MIVICPTYKNVAGITATLVLLNLQTELPDTVIIINTSGSEDIDKAVVAYAGNLTVSVIKETPCSIYKAWNLGLKTPSDLYWIINDDTVFPRQSISILKAAHEYSPEVFCWVPETPPRDFHSDSLGAFSFDCASAVENFTEVSWMPGFSFCLTDECVYTLGTFNTEYKVWWGDTAYQERILRNNHKIMKIGGFNVFHFGNKSYNYQSPEVKKLIDEDRKVYTKYMGT